MSLSISFTCHLTGGRKKVTNYAEISWGKCGKHTGLCGKFNSKRIVDKDFPMYQITVKQNLAHILSS